MDPDSNSVCGQSWFLDLEGLDRQIWSISKSLDLDFSGPWEAEILGSSREDQTDQLSFWTRTPIRPVDKVGFLAQTVRTVEFGQVLKTQTWTFRDMRS